MKQGIMNYMIALQECKQISAAAAKCSISQSSLSGYLNRLEDELGVTLYNRKSRELTCEGGIYVEAARAILAEDASARQKLRKFQTRSIRLGVDEYIDRKVVSQLVTELFMIHPEITLQLVTAPGSSLLDSLSKGSIDLAFCSGAGPAAPHLCYQEYIKEMLLLAVPEGYPIQSPQAPLNALKHLKLITLFKRTHLYALQATLLNHACLDPAIMFETNSPTLAANMITCGECAAIIPSGCTSVFGGCDLYPIPSAFLNSGLWYLRDQQMLPVHTELRKLLSKVLLNYFTGLEYVFLSSAKEEK